MGLFWLLAETLSAQCSRFNFSADITNGCAPVSVKLKITGYNPGEEFRWNFGSGYSSWSQSDSVKNQLFLNAGTISVSMQAKDVLGNTCTVTKSNYITISNGGSLKYYIDKPLLCDLNDSVSFIDSTPNSSSREWIVDGTVYANAPKLLRIKFNKNGVKSASLKVINASGCISSMQRDTAVVAYTAPYLSFTAVPDTGCPDLQSTINYAVGGLSSQGQYIIDQTWNTSGAQFPISSSTVAMPLYKKPGQYDVVLTIKTNKGCSYVKVKNKAITVFAPPKLRIAQDTLIYYCIEANRTFYNVTKKDFSTLGRFEWEFPNGGGQADPMDTAEIARDTINAKFEGKGFFGMRLKYFYKNCYVDTFYQNLVGLRETGAVIKVNSTDFCYKPAVLHVSDSLCTVTAPGTFKPFWTITDSLGKIVDTTRADTFTRTISTAGNYKLKLTIVSSWGCVSDIEQEIVVGKANLKIKKINPFGCPFENMKVVAQIASFDPKHNKTNVLWRFYKADDTTIFMTDTATTPVYFFEDTGWHNISCVAWNDKGCRDSVYDTSAVRIGFLKADFISVDTTIGCGEASFTLEQKTEPNVPGTLHRWLFQSQLDPNVNVWNWNNTSTTQLFYPGPYRVSVMALRTHCSDTATKDSFIMVNGVKAQAWVDTAISCAPLTLNAHSKIVLNYHAGSPDSSVFYVWECIPSEGVIIDSPNNAHTKITLTTPGCYQLNLSVYNSTNCNQLIEKVATLCLGNSAKYDISSIWPCVDDTQITFNKSIGSVSYKWIAEGGKATFLPSDTVASPRMIARDTNWFKLKMIATSSTGCKDSVVKHIYPMQALADFGISDTVAVCGPVTISLKAVPQKAVRYRWDFGDGSLLFNTDSPTTYHLYDIGKGKNKFNITLTAYDKFGCHYDVVKPNMLRIIGPVPNFSIQNSKGCDPLAVTFKDSSTGFNKQIFYNDNGGVIKNQLPAHTYRMKNAGDTVSVYSPYMLLFDTTINCAKAFRPEDSIWVYKSPKAWFGIMDTSACLTSTIRFRDSSVGVVRWFWDFDNDGIVDDTTPNPTHHYTKDGLYDVKLTIESRNGCRDSVIKPGYIVIPDRPLPGFFLSDSVLCYRQPVKFNDTTHSSRKLISWKWDFGEGPGKYSYAQNPTHLYKTPGNYYVKLVVLDISGCTDSLLVYNAVRMLDTIAADSTYLHYVSTAGNSVYTSWRKSSSPRFKNYRLYKWLPPQKVLLYESTDPNDTSFFDFKVNVNNGSYRYIIEMGTQCQQTPATTRIHNSIHIVAKPISPTSIYLKWNAYHGWDSMLYYELRKWEPLRSEFVTLAILKDTVFIDRHLCDSDYTYQVAAIHPQQWYISESNKATAHPPFVYPNKPVEVLRSTVEDDKLAMTYWDTSGVFEDTRMYVLHRLNDKNQIWQKLDSIRDDHLGDINAEVMFSSRSYYVTRRDFCGNISPKGNIGKTILLKAENLNDSTQLYWTHYQQWAKGISNYLLEIWNTETNRWERVANLKATDTSYTDRIVHNLTAPAFCYRVTAIEKGILPDSSRSNTACVTLPAKVYIPNAFTPNADGMNEVFRPVISFVYGVDANVGMQYRFSIYNRWGELIFNTQDPQASWDGLLNGKAVPSDVYLYLLEATSYKDKLKINKSGTFNLMR